MEKHSVSWRTRPARSSWLTALAGESVWQSVESALRNPRFSAYCLLCAVAVRLAWLVCIEVQPNSDFEWYFEQGQRIAAGRGYSVDHSGFPLWREGQALATPRATAFWPVGYPGFLGALFYVGEAIGGWVSALWLAKLANVALSVVTLFGLSRLSRLWFKSQLAERLTLLVASFAPNQIAYVALTASEVYYTALLILAVLALAHAKQPAHALSAGSGRVWLVLSGLLLGLATLTKPQSVLLPLLVLVFLQVRGPLALLRDAAWVYLPLCCVVLPWSLRNYFALGQFVSVSTNGWVNLLIGNMPGSWGHEGVMWNRQLHEVVQRHSDELSWNAGAKQALLAYVQEHPWRVLSALPRKVLALYSWDVDGFGWSRAGDLRRVGAPFYMPLQALAQAHYLAALALATYGVVRLRHALTPHLKACLAVMLYFTLVYTLFFGGPRFHYPVLPFVYLFTGAGFALLLQRSRAARLTFDPSLAESRLTRSAERRSSPG